DLRGADLRASSAARLVRWLCGGPRGLPRLGERCAGDRAAEDHRGQALWSDVLVGHAVGFSAGYLLSWGVYYRNNEGDAANASRSVWFPIVGSGVWGLAWSTRL